MRYAAAAFADCSRHRKRVVAGNARRGAVAVLTSYVTQRQAGSHPGDTVVPRRLTARAPATPAQSAHDRTGGGLQMRAPSIGDPRPPGYRQTYPGETENVTVMSVMTSVRPPQTDPPLSCWINATLSDYFSYKRDRSARLRLNCDLSRLLRCTRAYIILPFIIPFTHGDAMPKLSILLRLLRSADVNSSSNSNFIDV